MNTEIEVGKTYNVNHSRKGRFKMRVTAVSGEWISGVIVDGNPREQSNDRGEGDEITVRQSFSSFTEVTDAAQGT